MLRISRFFLPPLHRVFWASRLPLSTVERGSGGEVKLCPTPLPEIAGQTFVAYFAVNRCANRLAMIEFINMLRRHVEVLGHRFIEGRSMGVLVRTVYEFVEK